MTDGELARHQSKLSRCENQKINYNRQLQEPFEVNMKGLEEGCPLKGQNSPLLVGLLI